MKKVQVAIALILGLSALVGTVFGFNEYFAHQEDLDLLASRLEQKIQADQRINKQTRVWKLEERYQCFEFTRCIEVMPQAVREEYRQLMFELKEGVKLQ